MKCPKGLQFSKLLCIILLEGVLRTIGFKIICSKSRSITFYRSLGIRNHVETQKELSQGTSIQETSVHYLPSGGWGGGGSEKNRFENNKRKELLKTNRVIAVFRKI